MPLVDPPAARLFRDRFGVEPHVVARAPGRVNLIGDHTDYNDGFVLPMAIEQEIQVAVRALSQPTVQLASDQFGATAFRMDSNERAPGWAAYVQGVAREIRRPTWPDGFQLAVTSTIPAGTGLSSSAALEVGVARALTELAGDEWDPTAAALAAQRAENDWVGMQCGIMDQLSSAGGVTGHALLIDCQSLEVEPVPIPDTIEVVILDTRAERQLVGSEYNDRRAEGAAAATALGVDSLRQVTEADLDRLSGLPLRRARHVVSENRRVLAAARSLRSGDFEALQRIMAESHTSMKDDYETSAPAVDAMVEAAESAPGLIGVRLTGGGFGGCCVALVQHGWADRVAGYALDRYRDDTGIAGRAYVTSATAGASILEAA